MLLALDGTSSASAAGTDDRLTEIRGKDGTGCVGPMSRTVGIGIEEARVLGVAVEAFSATSAACAENAGGVEAIGIFAVEEAPRTRAGRLQFFGTSSIGTASARLGLEAKLHGVRAAGEDLKLRENLGDQRVGIRVFRVRREGRGGHQPKDLSGAEGQRVELAVAPVGDGRGAPGKSDGVIVSGLDGHRVGHRRNGIRGRVDYRQTGPYRVGDDDIRCADGITLVITIGGLAMDGDVQVGRSGKSKFHLDFIDGGVEFKAIDIAAIAVGTDGKGGTAERTDDVAIGDARYGVSGNGGQLGRFVTRVGINFRNRRSEQHRQGKTNRQ